MTPDRPRLPGPGLRRLGLGAALWLVPAALTTAVLAVAGVVRFTWTGPPYVLLLSVLALVPLVLLYEALPEELIFRGYVFGTAARRWPGVAAVWIQALAFTAWGIVIGAARAPDRVLLFVTFALGIVRALTASLWTSIGFHLAAQVTTQLLYGGWVAPPGPDVLRVGGGGTLQIVAYRLVPTVLVPAGVASAVALRRRGRAPGRR